MKIKTAFATEVALLISTFFLHGASMAQYAEHSVLNSGEWWKIAISEEGIYRIDASSVSDLNGNSIDNIVVYGIQGGILDVLNGNPRPDDLNELPIEIHDENSNGLFDGNDYIILYATGSDRWDYSSSMLRFVHTTHPYSTFNYLYLTASQSSHKRITTISNTYSGPSINNGHYVALHENNWSNAKHSGQRWVGERFYGGSMQHTISITLPSTPTGNIKLRYALVSTSSTSSTFTVTLNGTTRTHTMGGHTKYSVFYEEFPSNNNPNLDITFAYHSSESLAEGFIDFVEADAVAPLIMNNNYCSFRLLLDNAVHTCSMTAPDGTRIFDVTDYNNVREVVYQRNESSILFNVNCDSTRSFVAFNNNGFKNPSSIEKIANQDIHGQQVPDIVIVCNKSLTAQADSLAELHRLHDNLDVLVVTQEMVFNEYSGGQADPIAVRQMLRQMRSKQDEKPSSLLLFGKGTYDNRNLLDNNIATVITYETPESFDEDGKSIASDDFFTFLDDGESGRDSESRDVAVGRIPAKDSAEAKKIVKKISRYITRSDMSQQGIRGDWRNVVALLADDADPSCSGDTVFTNSSEITARQINQIYPQYTIDKIYADAYIQQSGADGSYYPDVNNALKKRIDYGCLILNYIGHGSSQYIGTERYITKLTISNYTNFHQLPFFITSTCTFGRYDDPAETCGAEEFLLADGAGIACIAASRPISHVQTVNTDMVMQALNPANTIGEAIRIAKNNRPTALAFTLFGDPALKLSYPEHTVVVTSINGHATDSLCADSAEVLSTVYIEGEIQDNIGNIIDDFDGVIYPEVYDRPVTTHTLANDNEGCEVTFTQQKNIIYKGQASVINGRFSYKFTVPRDVAFKYDASKLCHYAKSGTEDATGAYTRLYLGGYNESAVISESRPDIRLFINDTNFRSGGICDENPTLLALIYDSVGINAFGSGLGHDITAILDNNPNNIIILNDFYEPDINDEHLGSIRYDFANLNPGAHTISLKAWNIFNYSNSAEITFKVYSADDEATSFHAWPNPASDHISLHMEHNNKGKISNAILQIFNMRGSCLRTINPSVDENSYTIGPVLWNLTGDNGVRVAPGIYIARFIVTTVDGDKLTEQGKIIVK